MNNVYMIRYGEIGLKGKNRPVFERRLADNIFRALKGLSGSKVQRVYGRILVESAAEPEYVMDKLSKVFGIVGVCQVQKLPLDEEAISAGALWAVREAASRIRLSAEEKLTFKVETRRANKQYPRTSPELNGLLGGYLLDNFPELQVDVHNPMIKVWVEIREKYAYVYSADLPGPGGLPVGVSGKALLLLSGGIDSPVAGWMALKRGIEIEAAHFYSFPFTGEKSLEKVRDLCHILTGYTARIKLHIIHFTDIQKEIQLKCPEELRITLMRRMMFRLAKRIADEQGALALVTGESVGQVASQTLESMQVINQVVDIPVLRPLACMDKHETITRAQSIGTYETSILPFEDCCTLFLPKHPATKPRLEQAVAAEELLDIESLLSSALEKTKTEVITAR